MEEEKNYKKTEKIKYGAFLSTHGELSGGDPDFRLYSKNISKNFNMRSGYDVRFSGHKTKTEITKYKWLDDATLRPPNEELYKLLKEYIKKGEQSSRIMYAGDEIIDKEGRIKYENLESGIVYGGTLKERLGAMFYDPLYECNIEDRLNEKEKGVFFPFTEPRENKFYDEVTEGGKNRIAVVAMGPIKEEIIEEKHEIEEIKGEDYKVKVGPIKIGRKEYVIGHKKKLKERRVVGEVTAKDVLKEYDDPNERVYYAELNIVMREVPGVVRQKNRIVSVHFYIPERYKEMLENMDKYERINKLLELFKDAFPDHYQRMEERYNITNQPRYYYNIEENRIEKVEKKQSEQ
ncbi:MAG: hypothetical protein QXY70_03835 [Nanopusillaceae archaeon]